MTRAKTIASPVAAVAELRFFPIPTKPITVVKATRVDRCVVLIGGAGHIYTTEARVDNSYWAQLDDMELTLLCLVKLGMLNDSDRVEAEKIAARERHMREGRVAAAELIRLSKRLGVPLSDEQRSTVDALLLDVKPAVRAAMEAAA